MKFELKISLLIILFLVGIVFACWISEFLSVLVKKNNTRKLVESEAKHYLSYINKDQEYAKKNDAWGRPLEYEGHVEEDCLISRVKSAGPDGMFGSEDDVVFVCKDLNKSKIIGKWAGKKIKEAGSGFW